MHTLLLAAGGSRRLGQSKQLLRHRGSTLLFRSLALAHRLTPGRVSVVLGAERLRYQSVVQRYRRASVVIYNREWRRGMGHSFSMGLQQLAATGAKGVLILLCDQPRVTFSDLSRLKNAWRGRPQRAAAAHYQNKLGVPAIIPKRHWRQFSNLKADRGAGPWLNANAGRVTRVPMPSAELDVDTPEQLARL